MKSVQGLVVAIALGIAGAIFNWMYLNSGPSREATVSFVGVKQGQIVNRGELLREEQLVPLVLPETWVGNLKDFAVKYKDKSTVVGVPVSRTLEGECLLMNDDLKTPPPELKLEAGDSAMSITVDSRAFVPSLFNPGDTVSFMIPRVATPTPAMPGAPGAPVPPGVVGEVGSAPTSPVETIGPFTILALGNRFGSVGVTKAAKQQSVSENVLTIRVSPGVTGETEKAEKLWSLLQSSNFRQVGVLLHSRKKEKP
jgi:hypothetical protein